MNYKVKNVDTNQVRNKYANMVAEGKAAVVKGIAMGAAGTRQAIAKEVCEANGISLSKKVKSIDCSEMNDAVLQNILTMPHASQEKQDAAKAELEKRYAATEEDQ